MLSWHTGSPHDRDGACGDRPARARRPALARGARHESGPPLCPPRRARRARRPHRVRGVLRQRECAAHRRRARARRHRQLAAVGSRARHPAALERRPGVDGGVHPRPRRPLLRRRTATTPTTPPAARRPARSSRTRRSPARFDRYRATPRLQHAASTGASSRCWATSSRGRRTTATPTHLPASASTSTWAASASSCTTPAARPTTPPGCGCRHAACCCSGDLFIWASPERGQPAEGAALPERLGGGAPRTMAALGAEVLLPGPRPADLRRRPRPRRR